MQDVGQKCSGVVARQQRQGEYRKGTGERVGREGRGTRETDGEMGEGRDMI